MIKITRYSLLMAISLNMVSIGVQAELSTDKTVINSDTGSAHINVSFAAPIHGDLYLATVFNEQLIFFTANDTVSLQPLPLRANETFEQPMQVLSITSNGIPSSVYTLFQVVTLPGADPLDSANWIGGLSLLALSINLPTPAKSGQALYVSLTCSDSVCHTANPKKNINKVLNGTSLPAIRLSIKNNPITMGRFAGSSDADLQAIADYLKTF